MANHRGTLVYGFAGTATPSSGDLSKAQWTDSGNILTSDNSRASTTIQNGDTPTEDMRVSNFIHNRSFPTSGGPRSCIVEIEGMVTNILLASDQVVSDSILVFDNAGSTIGLAFAGNTPLNQGSIEERHPIWQDFTLSGETYADLGTNSGVEFVLQRDTGVTDVRLAEIDSVRRTMYLTASAKCNIRPRTPLTGGMAPYLIEVDALMSTVGDARPEDVAFRWTITGPAGFDPTTTSPLPNQGDTLDLKSEMWGTTAAWLADVEGTYTVTCLMFVKDGALYETIGSNSLEFTVAEDTRDVRYLDLSNGNDSFTGTASGAAWRTWGKVETELSGIRDWRLVVLDDSSVTETSSGVACSLNNVANIVIERSGDGSNKPLTRRTDGAGHILEIDNATDVVIRGLAIEGNSDLGQSNTNPNAFHNFGSINRLSIVDCDATYVQSFVEASDGGSFVRNVLLQNNTISSFTRYVVFTSGGGWVNIGNASTTAGGTQVSGEGHYRFNNNTGHANLDTIGTANNLFACSMDTSAQTNFGHSLFRHGHSFTHATRCYFVGSSAGSPIGFSHNPGSPSSSTFGLGFEVVVRFDACVFENVEFNWGYDAKHVGFFSSVLDTVNVSINGAGHATSYSIMGCTVISDPTSNGMFATQLTTTEAELHGFRFQGNLVLWEGTNTGPELDSVTARLFRNSTSRGMLETNAWAHNVFAADGSGILEANVSYGTIGDINSESWATDNSVVAVPENALSSSNDYQIDTGTYAIDILDPADIEGVIQDVRGIVRDVSASNWPVGAAGEESSETLVGWTGTLGSAFEGDAFGGLNDDPGSAAVSLSGPTSSANLTAIQTVESRGDGSNYVDLSSNVDVRVVANTSDAGRRIGGIRFTYSGDDIPAGATVGSATLKLGPTGNTSLDDADLTIHGVDASDPPAFNGTIRKPSDLLAFATTADLRVEQDDYPQTEGFWEFDITNIVQELITSFGLADGEAMSILVEGFLRVSGNRSLSFDDIGGSNPPELDIVITDTTAPVLSNPIAAVTLLSANISVTTDDAEGVIYWSLRTNATTPSANDVKNGVGAVQSDSLGVLAAGVQNDSITGLAAGTTYYLNFMHEDLSDNQSNIATISFSTMNANTADPSDLDRTTQNNDAPTANIANRNVDLETTQGIDNVTIQNIGNPQIEGPVMLDFGAVPENQEIRYTTNSRNPTSKSKLYTGPILITQNLTGSDNTVIKARYFDKTNPSLRSKIIKIQFRLF